MADKVLSISNGTVVEDEHPTTVSSETSHSRSESPEPLGQEKDITEMAAISAIPSSVASAGLTIPEGLNFEDEEDANETSELLDDKARQKGDLGIYKHYLSRSGYGTVAIFVVAMLGAEFLGEFSCKSNHKT